MPWSHIACGVFAAAVGRPYYPIPYGGLTFFMQTVPPPHVFLARRKVITSLAFLFNLTLNFFRNRNAATQQPHLKATVWPRYGGHAMAVKWHTFFTLRWGPRKLHGGLTASLRRPHGALAAVVRQACGSCNNLEGAVRSPPGVLAVTLRFLISWILRSQCSRRNICDHNYYSPQDLMIFKNHNLQTEDLRTVRRPYGRSMICDRGIEWDEIKTFPLHSVHVA